MKFFWNIVLVLLFSLSAQADGRKQPEPIRVACVGNSVTFGYGLQDRDHDAYPVQLQRLLGQGYEVANFGCSGATLLRRGHHPYMLTKEFRQAMEFGADWVVIHLGLNDTDPRNWPNYSEDFIPDYRALIDSLRVANPEAKVWVCLMTPIFDRHSRFQSGTRDWHAQIQQVISQIAATSDVGLIDLYSPLHSRPDLFPDALHPTAEGATILAQTVYGALTGDYGGLQLPRLYADGMVLQRNQPCCLHGRANAGQTVRVTLSLEGQPSESQTALVGADGRWSITLSPQAAGGPYSLSFESFVADGKGREVRKFRQQKQTVLLRDVWFGEVWLASGQSNMEFTLSNSVPAENVVAASSGFRPEIADPELHPSLRRLHLFNMTARYLTNAVEWPDSALEQINRLDYFSDAAWQPCSPTSARQFSAIAFHFGQMLADSLADVPIGIICNAVGGSTTEAWIDRTTLEWQYPAILRDWLHNDHTQDWARGRAALNVRHALEGKDDAGQPRPKNALQRHPYEPCYLFESGIASLEQYPLAGVIWYQGESNAHNSELHERLFSLMEESWRREWNRPDLPFYFVQLSSLNRPSWPRFRDSQRRLALSLPHTWMAVSSDVGDSLDVHFRLKQPVGERLALQALRHTYHHSVESEGPTLQSFRIEGSAAVLTMSHSEGMTVSRGFEMAGPDGIFFPAKAEVQGSSIRLTTPQVSHPAQVRYAWQPFTRADLRNRQGLPASTFLATPDRKSIDSSASK